MSNGSQIGAVVGGTVGAIGGFFLGNPTMGFAVGWAIGGAVGGMLDPEPDQITDFGAQAIPPFNTSLRGLTIPVLFGTNRVSSNIIWQSNYQTIRTLTRNDSGGKGGGSGGGKGPQQKTAKYTYKLDIIYHLGISAEPVDLLKIWNAGKVIDSTVTALIATSNSNYLGPDPQFDDQSTTLAFSSAAFYRGENAPAAGWTPLSSSVGGDVRWPNSVWVGFSELALGENPVIPQLSFEVGPQGDGFRPDPRFKWSAQLPTPFNQGFNGGTEDVHGNIWVFGIDDAPTLVYDSNGNLLQTHSWATLGAAALAFMSGFPHGTDPTSNGTNMCCYGALVCGGTRVLFHFQAGTLPYTYVFGVGQVQPDGTINVTGSCAAWGIAGIFPDFTYAQHGGFAFLDEDADTESYILAMRSNFSNQFRCQFCVSIGQMEGVLRGTRITYVGLTHASFTSYQLEFNPLFRWDNQRRYTSISDPYFCLPYGGDVYLYFYSGPDVHNPTGQFLTDRNNFNASRGGLSRWKISTSVLPELYVASNPGIFGLNDPEFITKFRDEDGNLYGSFDDHNMDFETGTTSTANVRWQPKPALIEKLETGLWLVIFYATVNSNANYINNTNYLTRIKLRAFTYSQLTGEFTEYDRASGVLYPVKTAYSAAFFSATDPDMDQVGIARDGDYLRTYIIGNGYLIRADFGRLILLGGADITPPQIIREILVNDVFGVYPGADIIDSTTYNTAVTYCENNNIRISCQYRRDGRAWDFIERLLAVYDGYLSIDASAGRIKFGVMDFNSTPVRTIDNDRLLRQSKDRPPVNTTKGAIQDTYNLVRVSYIDRDLEYKQNQVEEGDEVDQDLNGVRMREFPPDFVMPGWLASRMASRSLWTNLYTRDRHRFYLGWKDADLEPGDVITLVDSFTNLNQVVQIARMTEVERGVFEVDAAQMNQYIPGTIPSQVGSFVWTFLDTQATSFYSNVSSPSQALNDGIVTGLRYARMYELPYEFEIDGIPRIYVGWIPEGNAAGATLYISADGSTYGATQQITPYPVTGRILTNLAVNNLPYHENVPVVLYPTSSSINSFDTLGTLVDVDASGMHSGTGLFWVGSEMIAYQGATLVSQNRYTLDKVYRGWGGTVPSNISSGAMFWKQGGGVFVQEYTTDRIGQVIHYKVAPFDFRGNEFNVASIQAGSYTILGTFYRPSLARAPEVNSERVMTRLNVGSAGDVSLFWRNHSPRGGYGVGGYGKNTGGYGGFVADPNSLGWRVEIVGSGGVVVRSAFVNTPAFTYTNSQNFADNGAWRGNVAVRVTPRNAYGDAMGSAVTSLELFF